MTFPFADITFPALPGSPHLTYSPVGYSLLNLEGLPNVSGSVVPADQIERVTVQMVEQRFRVLSPTVITMSPGIPKLEAQTVRLFLKAPPPKPYAPLPIVVEPPKDTYGFTAPSPTAQLGRPHA